MSAETTGLLELAPPSEGLIHHAAPQLELVTSEVPERRPIELEGYRRVSQQEGFPSVRMVTVYPRNGADIVDPTHVLLAGGHGLGISELSSIGALVARTEGCPVTLCDHPRIKSGSDPNRVEKLALMGVMRELGADKNPIYVVGNSRRGISATQAVAEFPGQAVSLGLIASGGFSGPIPGRELAMRALHEAMGPSVAASAQIEQLMDRVDTANILGALEAVQNQSEHAQALGVVALAGLLTYTRGGERVGRMFSEAFNMSSRSLKIGAAITRKVSYVMKGGIAGWEDICAIGRADCSEDLGKVLHNGVPVVDVVADHDGIFPESDTLPNLQGFMSHPLFLLRRVHSKHTGVLTNPAVLLPTIRNMREMAHQAA
ncbi:MAG: hypothetical protein JWL85_173 [Candidatus Saccharibacteria bacterium]|nr:hypothetical protein [Candidatus Saccharibacteria bacterium]